MHSLAEQIAILTLATTLAACGESAPGSATSTSGTSSSASSGLGGSGSGSTSATGSGTGGGGTGGAATQSEVPTSSPEAVFAYLKSGAYTSFPAESAIHPSTGPHGGSVRTYLTPALKASLEAGNAVHPLHAAVVKELYGSGATVVGWAVAVKTKAASDGGNGWYWYEIYSTTNPSNPIGAANGVALCVNCHVAGKDFILTPIPLQ